MGIARCGGREASPPGHGSGMNVPSFYAAAAQAVRDLTTGDLDGEQVPPALQLAVYAWQRCPPSGARARWDLFGMNLSMARDQLSTPPHPTAVRVAEHTLPDTDQLRRLVGALTAAVAERLDDAAANRTPTRTSGGHGRSRRRGCVTPPTT